MSRPKFEAHVKAKYGSSGIDVSTFNWNPTKRCYDDPVGNMLWTIYNAGKKDAVTKDAKYIILRRASKGVLVGSLNPRWHGSERKAVDEAERLAETTGHNFTVFAAIRNISVANDK